MGVDKTTSNVVYDALINGAETAQLIVTTPYGDVLPSSKALAGAGVEIFCPSSFDKTHTGVEQPPRV